MPIRFATLSDVPALVEGAAHAHALTRFRSQPYDAPKVAHAFTELIQQRQSKYGCFVAEDAAGRVVGALIGSIERQILSGACTASVMHFNVLPESRASEHAIRLLGAFEAWSMNRGAIEIAIGRAEMQRFARLARKLGFRATSRSYVKEARPC